MAHRNAGLLETFYRALADRDAAAMWSCYHPKVHFTDELFDLHGAEVRAMWTMLCERGEDLEVEYGEIEADDHTGQANWQASYTFLATNRKVRNSIDARFEFRNRRIIRHVDAFDFWSWSRQALGPPGLLLGWSGLFKARVARTASRNLARFSAGS